jgi:hypothetical protein
MKVTALPTMTTPQKTCKPRRVWPSGELTAPAVGLPVSLSKLVRAYVVPVRVPMCSNVGRENYGILNLAINIPPPQVPAYITRYGSTGSKWKRDIMS